MGWVGIIIATFIITRFSNNNRCTRRYMASSLIHKPMLSYTLLARRWVGSGLRYQAGRLPMHIRS